MVLSDITESTPESSLNHTPQLKYAMVDAIPCLRFLVDKLIGEHPN